MALSTLLAYCDYMGGSAYIEDCESLLGHFEYHGPEYSIPGAN